MTNLNGRELNIDELERASGGSVVTQLIEAFNLGVALELGKAERWKNMPKAGTGECKNHNGV
jgi:hypothetical protein